MSVIQGTQFSDLPRAKSPTKAQPSQSPTEPCETLYVRNLIETRALRALRESLSTVFSQFGEIIDISIKRNVRMRGQAFVTFKEKDSSTKAIKEVQGFPLFLRPMDIQYARCKSYKLMEILDGKEAVQKLRKRKLEERAPQGKETKKVKTESSGLSKGIKIVNNHLKEQGYNYRGAQISDELLAPNSILFVQNLPPQINDTILTEIFGQFVGLKEVRLVPGKSGIAFVEYEDEAQSAIARQTLNKYKIGPEYEMVVTFAKK